MTGLSTLERDQLLGSTYRTLRNVSKRLRVYREELGNARRSIATMAEQVKRLERTVLGLKSDGLTS